MKNIMLILLIQLIITKVNGQNYYLKTEKIGQIEFIVTIPDEINKVFIEDHNIMRIKERKLYQSGRTIWSESKYGYITNELELISSLQYKEATNFIKESAFVRNDNGFFLIDNSGQIIRSYKGNRDLSIIGRYSYNRLLCYDINTRLYGVIDEDFKTVVPFDFVEIYGFEDNSVLFYQGPENYFMECDGNCYYGIIDINKGEIIKEFSPKYAYVAFSSRKNLYDVTDINWNKYVVDIHEIKESENNDYLLEYDFIETHSSGISKVKKNSLYGYIDSKGKVKTPINYESVLGYFNGIAAVQIEDKYVLVNKSGDIITENYDDIYITSKGFIIVKNDGLYGIIKDDGEILCPLYFDSFDNINEVFTKGEYSYQIFSKIKNKKKNLFYPRY